MAMGSVVCYNSSNVAHIDFKPSLNGKSVMAMDNHNPASSEDSPNGPFSDHTVADGKRVAAALRESEQRLRAIFEQAAVGVAQIVSKTGRFERINQRYADIVGYTVDEMKTLNFQQITHPEDLQEDLDNMERLLSGEITEFSMEKRYYRRDGSIVWVNLTVSPMWKPGDEPDYHIAVVEDITNRKRAEETLRESEEMLRAIADYTYDWESWFGPDGRLMWVNPAVEKLTGYSVDECRTMVDYPLPIVHEEDRAQFGKRLRQAVADKASASDVEFRISRKSGTVEWMSISWQAVYDRQDKHIGQRTSVRSITDRKAAEEALRTSEQKYRVLFEQTADATLIIDDNTFVDCNDAVVKMLRYKNREELLETHPSELSPRMQPDGRESYDKANEMMAIAYEKGSHRFEWDHRRADGEVFPVEVLLTAIPVGEKKILYVVWRDITERKQIEKEREDLIAKLEAQNAELERFTYTVSHDLRSPLITIQGFVGMLRKDLVEGDLETVEEDLARISGATDKMNQLLKDLLELSRIGRLVHPTERVSMEELTREAVEILDGQIRKNQVLVEIADGLPDVYGDRIRLLELVQNLIDNAVKYVGVQAHPQVEIGSRHDADGIVMYVRDNGIGIDPEYHERVFGLFDQLDQKVDGCGIGLSLVKRIAELHGGKVWVESEGMGHGSTFCFTIPGGAEGVDWKA